MTVDAHRAHSKICMCYSLSIGYSSLVRWTFFIKKKPHCIFQVELRSWAVYWNTLCFTELLCHVVYLTGVGWYG